MAIIMLARAAIVRSDASAATEFQQAIPLCRRKGGLVVRRTAILVVAGMMFVSASRASSIREPIRPEGSEHPAWIPAELATTDDGSVRWDLFAQNRRGDLQMYTEALAAMSQSNGAPLGKCTLEIPPEIFSRREPYPMGSLEELTQHAAAMYRGRVLDVTSGLYKGILGSLALVAVEDAREAVGGEPPEEILVFVQSGTLALRDGTVCRVGDRVPSIGMRLIVFYPETAGGTLSRGFILPLDEELFLERPDGSASLPKRMMQRLGADFAITFDELLQRVEVHLTGEVDR